ncbi:MAG: ACT domain-containing protein [Methanomassiliicoccales archaeon]|nr:ACT domain-containing protein [Methanomassiliicoccales archaeon]
MSLDREAFRGMKVLVRAESYAIAKAARPIEGAFAVVDDGREITVVIDQSLFEDADAREFTRDWKMITFDAILPLDLVGFLSFVAGSIAKIGASIFVISAYSTDHLLVRERDLDRVVAKLREMGFEVCSNHVIQV